MSMSPRMGTGREMWTSMSVQLKWMRSRSHLTLPQLQIGFHIKKTESHEVYDTEQLAQVFITVSRRSR